MRDWQVKSSRRSLFLTAVVASVFLLVPPALARFGAEPVQQFMHALRLGALSEWLDSGGGVLQFASTHRRVGVFESGQAVEFVFENVGDEPVLLTRTWASCGCVRVVVPTTPVAPGASGKVLLYLDTAETSKGATWQLAKVYPDVAPDQPYVLMIEGEVR